MNLYVSVFSAPIFPKIHFFFEEKRRHGFVAFFPIIDMPPKRVTSRCLWRDDGVNTINVFRQWKHIRSEDRQPFVKRCFVHNNLFCNVAVLTDVCNDGHEEIFLLGIQVIARYERWETSHRILPVNAHHGAYEDGNIAAMVSELVMPPVQKVSQMLSIRFFISPVIILVSRSLIHCKDK